jgi:hypothetical protein
MFEKIKELWNDKGFEIVLGFCIAIILIFGLYNIITNKKGTWSKNYDTYFTNKQDVQNLVTHTGPPKNSKGEIECRRCLEKIFNKPFPNKRPDFLRNPVTSNYEKDINLEIDCYNEELRLGVEFQGIQHSKYNKFFHGDSKEKFYNQRYRDVLKKHMCKDVGVTLIEVPYTVKTENIEQYLINELRKNGYIK